MTQDWCINPVLIRHFAISSPNHETGFPLDDNFALLCQVDQTKYGQQPDTDSSLLWAIWDGEKTLIDFTTSDVIFKLMSGSDFCVLVTSPNRERHLVKGSFVNFADFEYFHSLACQDCRFSVVIIFPFLEIVFALV